MAFIESGLADFLHATDQDRAEVLDQVLKRENEVRQFVMNNLAQVGNLEELSIILQNAVSPEQLTEMLAAEVFACWLQQFRSDTHFFFLIKRNPDANRVFVVTSSNKPDEDFFKALLLQVTDTTSEPHCYVYHFTNDKGLYEVDRRELKRNFKLKDELLAAISSIITPIYWDSLGFGYAFESIQEATVFAQADEMYRRGRN